MAEARGRFPGRAIRDVRMLNPTRFNVYFWAPEKGPAAVDVVRFELPSERLAGEARARDDKSLWTLALPVHTGEMFGIVGRVIVLLGGLGLAALATTGPPWLQRPRPGMRPS